MHLYGIVDSANFLLFRLNASTVSFNLIFCIVPVILKKGKKLLVSRYFFTSDKNKNFYTGKEIPSTYITVEFGKMVVINGAFILCATDGNHLERRTYCVSIMVTRNLVKMNQAESQLEQRKKTAVTKLQEKLQGFRRTRSLNAPSPIQQFGPCGRIMKNSAMAMTIQDPASQRLTWYKPPLTVLVVKKVRDSSVLQLFVDLVQWLIKEKRMVVFVEESIMEDVLLTENSEFVTIKDKLMYFKDGKDDLTDKIDFIICLGGDGTLLYASLLFQQSVPPIMAFHLGSLGFLTPFKFENFQEQVTNVLEGHAALTLRSRLKCTVMRKNDDPEKDTEGPITILVLNEVVIDRGPSPYLSNIDLFLDGKPITSVQGDGLIVSTPTGSTAYAVAAGASMIHPSVPAIMVTPICPHSLSFRPIVVPAGVELKIMINEEVRHPCWASFDGRHQLEIFPGDSLRVTTSIYPVPSICAEDQISDWFDSLAECLHWNVRKRQKQLDELSDLTYSSSNDTLDSLDQTDGHL